jgi:hypothetical protein
LRLPVAPKNIPQDSRTLYSPASLLELHRPVADPVAIVWELEDNLMKTTLRKLLLCGVLGFGSLAGVPMKPREIEELMWAMSQPKVAQTDPEEADKPDPLKRIQGL